MNSPTFPFSLLRTLAWTDFKLRYHGSVLGYVWALLKPLLIFCVLFVVFQFLFGSTVEYYALRLLTAIMLWSFFNEATTVGMHSLLHRSKLVTKVAMPRWIIPSATLITTSLGLLINLGILAVFFVAYGKIPDLGALLLFPVLLALFLLMTAGIVFATATLLPRFRDLGQIWEVLLNALMYATPIIYPLSAIPEAYRGYFYLNPLTPFFETFRALLIDNVFPSIQTFSWLALCSLAIFFAGILIFNHTGKRLPEYL